MYQYPVFINLIKNFTNLEIFSIGLLFIPIIYWSAPKKIRFWFISLISLGIIGFFDILSLAIIFSAAIIVDIGIRLKKTYPKKTNNILFFSSIFVLIALLISKLMMAFSIIIYEEFNFEVFLPLGISYYSFKLIHFVVEYTRKGANLPYKTDQFILYLFLPTIFFAGPIQRYDLFLANIENNFSWESITYGLTRIAYGLIKQFFIIGLIINQSTLEIFQELHLSGPLDQIKTPTIWFFLLIFYLKIYLNFSAYTDLAIGASRVFGFRIMENFNWPIFAITIDNFWQRWHMTLSYWCREYIYFPILSIYRRPILASYATFAIIGLWHSFSLNRLFWGLMHGTALVVYFFLKKKRKSANKMENIFLKQAQNIFSWGVTQAFVTISMSALVIEGNDVYQVYLILCKLFFITI